LCLKDEKEFRNFITWLENQKIRSYKVDDRVDLDRVEDENWPNAFQKVFYFAFSFTSITQVTIE